MDDPYTSPQTSPSNKPPQLVPAARSSWPTVLGIIAIVFGVLGVIGGVFGLLGPVMYKALGTEAMAQGGMTPEFMGKWGIYMIINPIVMGVIATILLAGGVLLLLRKPKAVKILQTWSVLKILYGVVASIFGFAMQRDQIPAMMNNMPTDAESAEFMEQMGSIMSIAGPVGIVFSFLWAAALPVFLLIWFARRPIKSEVETWN